MTDLTAEQIEEAMAVWDRHDPESPDEALDCIYDAAFAHRELLCGVESGRKVVVDRLCQTCGGSGYLTIVDSLGKSDGSKHPCPDCTDGLVPYIALTKQGGEWNCLPEQRTFLNRLGSGLSEWASSVNILDALAEASENGEGAE